MNNFHVVFRIDALIVSCDIEADGLAHAFGIIAMNIMPKPLVVLSVYVDYRKVADEHIRSALGVVHHEQAAEEELKAMHPYPEEI